MGEKSDLQRQASLLSDPRDASMPARGRCAWTPIGAQRPLYLDVSKNASVSLAGRCTSTPIGPSRLSFSRLGAGDMFDISPDSCSTIQMDDSSAVPIFGRQNLKWPSDRRRKGDEPGARKILPKHRVHQPALANVEKTFDDCARTAEASSSARRQVKKATNGNIVGNKRRSTHNDSRAPIFKVTPKVSKSPRLLTAIRAKQRANREKARNAEMVNELERKKTAKKQEICAKPMRPMAKISPTTFNKFKITIPVSPKIRKSKKLS